MWETNAIYYKRLTKTYNVCKQLVPGFPGNVPVHLDVAKFALANCRTAAQPWMNPQKHTAVDYSF